MFIAVATHKKIEFQLPNGYNPVQINSYFNEKWPKYFHDADGDNIAKKNYCYCELTAMYWLWKNVNSDIKGLCHYRRYFSNNKYLTMSEMDYFEGKSIKSHILSEEEVKIILKDYDAIVVRPYRPYPMQEVDDLKVWCYEKDIAILKNVIYENYPDYIEAFEKIMRSTNLSHYNMLIANADIFNEYSKWIFGVLTRVESRTDIENYDVQHKRIYGYLAEMLLNVYIDKNRFKVKYVKIVEPAEFVGINSKDLRKGQRTEKIQELFIRWNLYKFVELIYRAIKTEKYEKYKKLKESMENNYV